MDEQIQGGKLGGLRAFDEMALKPAFDELGRLAIAISSAINHQHEIGMDLEGDLGGNFFSDVNSLAVQRSRVVPNGNNDRTTTGQLAVEITDSSQLPAGTWELQFSGDGRSYELIDTISGDTVKQGRLPDPVQSEINMPGFNIRVEGGEFNAGDKYLIQPSRNAAENMQLNIRREEDLAFASPVRASSDDGNLGTGTINQGNMLNVRNPNTGALLDDFQNSGQFADGPITVTFSNDGAGNITYEVANDSGVLFTSAAVDNDGDGTPDVYDPQKINQIFSTRPEDESNGQYRGFVFEITGEPADGDVFTIDFNRNGVSDNRNAELMAALGTKNTLNGGSQNFTEGYAGLVEDIGVKTRQSQLDKDAGATLLEQSTNQRESVSGVNLDEEAGKLIQYQAAYNASAQVMSVAQDLFNTLLQSFR